MIPLRAFDEPGAGSTGINGWDVLTFKYLSIGDENNPPGILPVILHRIDEISRTISENRACGYDESDGTEASLRTIRVDHAMLRDGLTARALGHGARKYRQGQPLTFVVICSVEAATSWKRRADRKR